MMFGCWVAATIVFLTNPHYYVLSILLWLSSLSILGNVMYNEKNKSILFHGIPFFNIYIYLSCVKEEQLVAASKVISIKRMTFRIVEDVPMIIIAIFVMERSVVYRTSWITWLNLIISSTNIVIWCLYEVAVMKNCICPQRVEEQPNKETVNRTPVDATSIGIETM